MLTRSFLLLLLVVFVSVIAQSDTGADIDSEVQNQGASTTARKLWHAHGSRVTSNVSHPVFPSALKRSNGSRSILAANASGRFNHRTKFTAPALQNDGSGNGSRPSPAFRHRARATNGSDASPAVRRTNGLSNDTRPVSSPSQRDQSRDASEASALTHQASDRSSDTQSNLVSGPGRKSGNGIRPFRSPFGLNKTGNGTRPVNADNFSRNSSPPTDA